MTRQYLRNAFDDIIFYPQEGSPMTLLSGYLKLGFDHEMIAKVLRVRFTISGFLGQLGG